MLDYFCVENHTTVTTNSLTDDYLSLIDLVYHFGNKVAPRGFAITELENFTLVLTNPRDALPRGIGRKHSNRILAAESMQWLAGVSDLLQLDWASKNGFSKFSDDGTRLYGAYGPRAHNGLKRAVRLLAKDPDSRQAVVSLWNNNEADKTKDLPCTLNWGFRIRDGKLNMSTTMRSWDAWTGLTYDLPAMTRIQSAMAWALNVEVGSYVHNAYSFHIYESNDDAISKLVKGRDALPLIPMLTDGFDETFEGTRPSDPNNAWEAMLWMADAALKGSDGLPAGFQWFSDALKDSLRNPHFCEDCRFYLPSGELFCGAR